VGSLTFYALRTDSGTVLFDTGINPPLAKRGLNKLGISPDSVSHIFLTHTDYDHAGGLMAFPQAKVYLSKAEEQMINGQTARRGIMRNKRISSYHTMEDGDTIVIGGKRIKLHLTPGHTPGSAAYLVDGHILISGDLLRISRKGTILPFLWLMNMNHSRNAESIESMRSVIDASEYILTGHTGIKVNNK